MQVVSKKISFSTSGDCDIVEITPRIYERLRETSLSTGIINIFVPGATGAVTTVEYEPGLINDLRNFFGELIPETGRYFHDSHIARGNAHSHLRASLVGPSLDIPFEGGALQLGTYQQVIFIDFDNRPRNRDVVLKIIGE
jgi:secondary thiamine-phosphate synthase enzyme